MILRRSISEDAAGFMAVKQRLPMPLAGASTTTGGFLLGTSEERYRQYISNDLVMTLEDDATCEVVGFSIILKDETLRQSDVWKKKDLVDLTFLPEGMIDRLRVAYFDQLAILDDSRYRRYGHKLALLNLVSAFNDHDGCFCTIVKEPIHNKAALPFLLTTGFVKVGEVAEVYEDAGNIISEVYVLLASMFWDLYEQQKERFDRAAGKSIRP